MLVRCDQNIISKIPRFAELRTELDSWFSSVEDRLFLTIGKMYLVYALTFRGSIPWYFIADDTYDGKHYPFAYPARLFSLVDNRVSRHWVFGFAFSRGDESRRATMTSLFAVEPWAKDETFFERLVDGEDDCVKRFDKYKGSLDCEFPNPAITLIAGTIDANWLNCPKCGEAWEASPHERLVKSPQCATVMVNPPFSNTIRDGAGGTLKRGRAFCAYCQGIQGTIEAATRTYPVSG